MPIKWLALNSAISFNIPVGDKNEETLQRNSWQYAAGFFDAEGCITANTDRTVRVRVSNTERLAAKWFLQNFGGRIQRQENHQGFGGDRSFPIYHWEPGSKAKAEMFLTGITPYLVLKREQALIALSVVRTWGRHPNERDEMLLRLSEEKKNLMQRSVEAETRKQIVEWGGTGKDKFRYAAGVIDGDGCISLGSGSCVIQVTQRPFFIVQWLLDQIGGTYHVGRNGMYTWRLYDDKEAFLLRVLPYLRFKRWRAKAALMWLRHPADRVRIEQQYVLGRHDEMNRKRQGAAVPFVANSFSDENFEQA